MASDGECLRVYQAVIDARTLLAEVSSSEHRSRMAAVRSIVLVHFVYSYKFDELL